MKKIIKIVNLILMMLILNGCMKLDVNCGIKKDYTAYLKYNIKINTQELDDDLKTEINTYLENFVDAYEEYGFSSTNQTTDNQISMTLTYEKSASNYEEAYDNLKSILNDPNISFLLSTDMTTVATDYEQGFTFNATTDVSKILGTSYFETLPYNISSIINNGMEGSEINFIFSLPESTIVETNGDIKNESGNTTITFPVSLVESSDFKATARMSIDNNKAVQGDTNSLIQKNKQTISMYKTLIVVVSISIIGLIIVFACLIIKQRKNKKLY